MQPLFFALLCATAATSGPTSEGSVTLPEFQSFRDRTPLIQLKSTAGSGDFLVVDTAAAEELQQAEEQVAHAELKAIEERLARIVVDHPTTSAAAKAKNTLAKAGLKVTDDGRVIEDHVFAFTVPFNR